MQQNGGDWGCNPVGPFYKLFNAKQLIEHYEET